MENEFLSKVEDNTAVRAWSEKLQTEKGDSLAEGYTSELQNFTCIIVTQNEQQELKDIWTSWDEGTKQLFYQSYGDIPYLLDVKVDKRLFRGIAQFWNAAYNCFTFREVDLVPTLKEYTTLLRSSKAQARKIYAKITNSQTFVKRLVNISGMSESWVTVRIQQKGDSKCIPWENLRDLILTHLDEKKRVQIFALSIYGLVIFPRALRRVDEAVTDLFDRLGKGVTPVPAILAETCRSLSMCRKAGEGRFISCAQLLMVWFHWHFWKVDKVSYRVFSEGYSPLKEEIAMQMRDDISEEKRMEILQNLKEDDVEWRAFWMYKSRQFILTTHGLAQCELLYKRGHYRKKVRELSDAWRQMHRMKRLTVGSMVTPEYNRWFRKRVNDNIPRLSLESARPMEKQLQIALSELEIINQDFEKKSFEFRKKIEQLEEEKMHLKLEVEIQKSETEKLQKRKGKVEEDLESLKTDYKKLCLSMRTTGLGKTSEQWCQEV
ncbi:uncharacterized protein LOC108451706 [Gossypium arboreum]|uniref:uncharacterized protein LOC108451706 n=1 Tax=Gossypium arboreum TaxID=29729 RepID=UPI0008196406|nr:uncharacterized protein LOC108451706 [Gossypium arboreum]